MTPLPPNEHPLNCTYNRDDVAAGLRQYYLTLTSAAYVPAAYVDFPPPQGWSDAELDVGALRALRRSEAVIDLLRHLPYPRPMHDGPRPGPWNVAPRSRAVRYLRPMGDFAAWSDRGDAGLLELAALPLAETGAAPMDLPPDVVCLTRGERWSRKTKDSLPFWWIVDLARGGVLSPFQEKTYQVSRVPRNKPWRTAQSLPAAEFFAQLAGGIPFGLVPLPPTEELDAEIIQGNATTNVMEPHIYRYYDWQGGPDKFHRDECIVHLQNYRREKLEEERRRIAQDVDDADDEDFSMDESDDDDAGNDEGESGLVDTMADMEMDDLSAEAAALRADMLPEERARFDQRLRENQLPFEWVDEE